MKSKGLTCMILSRGSVWERVLERGKERGRVLEGEVEGGPPTCTVMPLRHSHFAG